GEAKGWGPNRPDPGGKGLAQRNPPDRKRREGPDLRWRQVRHAEGWLRQIHATSRKHHLPNVCRRDPASQASGACRESVRRYRRVRRGREAPEGPPEGVEGR